MFDFNTIIDVRLMNCYNVLQMQNQTEKTPTEILDQYTRTTEILDRLMKVVQRDWDNNQSKVDALSILIGLKEIVDRLRKESSGTG